MDQATVSAKATHSDFEKGQLLRALIELKNGDFTAQLPSTWTGLDGKIADTFNSIVELNRNTVQELDRLSRVVGKDGKLSQRAVPGAATGSWADTIRAVNTLIDDLVHPTSETARVIGAVAKGDLSQSMALDIEGRPLQGEFRRTALTVNTMVDQLASFASEVTRVAREVGTEGKLGGQAQVKGVAGTWKDLTDNVNLMASNLTSQVRNIATVTTGVANGDLSKKITVDVRGEFLELKNTVNTMVDQLNSFASEVTRVAREVGTEGKLGGQADVRGAAGTWKDLTDSVNFMAGNLTSQVRNIADVGRAVAAGDLSKKVTVDVKGELLEVKNTMNTMVDQLNFFASEVTRMAREVGTEGKLGGQADVRGAAGTWKDLTDSVNFMAGNLTSQVRNIADVGRAVAAGDLTKKVAVDVKGELLEVKNTMNTMVDQLNFFASEVTRVAREVGTEGKLGGQADVRGAAGTWKDLTDNVNFLAGNLTSQVRNFADVTRAVAAGDLSKKITVNVQGEFLEVKNTVNTMVDQLNSFASEVTRVAREVGTEGKLGGQADVRGTAGTWKDLTDSVNFLASNLTSQVRNIADVGRAVAAGDLSKKITVNVQGEFLEVKSTMNTMVDQLNSFASEVTRVAREVGTEGKLGGQAEVKGVSGTWKGLTDSVNFMADNLTSQVRGIAKVVTAVANGDLKRKLTVEAKGEVAELADTINNMTDTLATFADQVTSVAREVGVEGRLGGQALVPGAAGTWKDLTDNVNRLAANLTTQVRALADVATAVTKGDLTRSITVVAQGEVAALKDNINEMIGNLRETTIKNTEQDWLKTNLAKFSRMLQGQKDMLTVGQLILSELAPVVAAQQAVFYILVPRTVEAATTVREEPCLRLLAGYAVSDDHDHVYRLGEGLVGQCAMAGKKILLTDVPDTYFSISSGLGAARPHNVIVLPVLFEGKVKGVMELASFSPFSQAHEVFLDQLTESIGIVLNTIEASTRTEDLLTQSQSQARELLSQQEELQKTNQQLEEKAGLLANQYAEVERKNQEVEQSRSALEEKAKQLALTSKYKSEFLANMSHELRTPLNSLLILSDQLSRNPEGNLHLKQVDYAKTIHASGNDLLSLINDILDLSKIESGTVTVETADLSFIDLRGYVERTFTHVAEQRKLRFVFTLDDDLPPSIYTDAKRLQQVIKNLLSNAFKFTEHGVVGVRVGRARGGWNESNESLSQAIGGVLSFSVSDTGIGIPADKQQIIFEAFQQADGSTSRKYGGTGLGLAISREITHMLGGEMYLKSLPGQGSTFTFFLPAVYSPAKTPRRSAGNPTIALQVPDAPPAKIPDVVEWPEPVRPVDEIADDRARITASDTVLLVVDQDREFVLFALEIARAQGFKVMVTTRGGAAIALTRHYRPAAIVLDMGLTDIDGWRVLQNIKNDLSTRHIPVTILSHDVNRERALREGAFSLLTKPVIRDVFDRLLPVLRATSEGKTRRLLIVEDNQTQRDHLVALLSGTNIAIVAVGTAHEAISVLKNCLGDCLHCPAEGLGHTLIATTLKDAYFDCVILDLGLPDLSGLPVAEALHALLSPHFTPLIILTGKDLSPDDEVRLRTLSTSIVIKDFRAPEVLLDEVSVCLHRPHNHLTPAQRKLVDSLHRPETVLKDRKILVVDDDMRNIFAMTSLLERFEMKVTSAENGMDAIAALDLDHSIEMVLMDIMMPEMDGYETMRSIRLNPRLKSLPIIALTAKAMKGDREKCLDAGASDYISKPVDTDGLLSLLCIWLYQRNVLSQVRK
jgi:hypothetical protein